ncbi:DNA polymerase III epsilon subunit-like protein [Hamadaea flava]|uniref:PolC-type DNA polymerase III n=1 Tax=Hamadaea flava TaxID=1742688 RepID=A0ABV8LI13_9ACTN|nr:3'-5' exonuclease [Hamadaea flava]MCP2325229.1 DNA polymerase III epsilon subunit-like protein [Hamadaea flava]
MTMRIGHADSIGKRRGTPAAHAKYGRLAPVGSPLWHAADIVALDLEGSGAQDHAAEAILEVAAVPLLNGQPDLDRAFTSLVNPGRPIPPRSWLAPGLTDGVLATAPAFDSIAPTLAELIDGKWVLGHNVQVDWRLLSGHLPGLRPAGLLDTLQLARTMAFPDRKLSTLVDSLRLREAMHAAAGSSQPHRAYWDSVAAAYLLPKLIYRLWPKRPPTFESLRLMAGVPLPAEPVDQPGLFD